jgi:hypothetical protein
MKIVLNKEKIKAFCKPLMSLMNTIKDDDGGVILNVDKTTNEITISAKKDSVGTVIFVKYKKDLLEGIEIDKDEQIGILKLSEFIKYFSVIDDDKTELLFDNNKFVLSNGDANLSFKTADVDMIKEGPKTFKGASWYSEVVVDSKFEKLNKAMAALNNEDCVYIEGDKDSGVVTFTVKSSNIEINKFSTKIMSPVTQNFDLPFNKEYFTTALSIPTDSVKLSISERFINVQGETKYFSISYFVAKKTIK